MKIKLGQLRYATLAMPLAALIVSGALADQNGSGVVSSGTVVTVSQSTAAVSEGEQPSTSVTIDGHELTRESGGVTQMNSSNSGSTVSASVVVAAPSTPTQTTNVSSSNGNMSVNVVNNSSNSSTNSATFAGGYSHSFTHSSSNTFVSSNGGGNVTVTH